MTALNLHPLTGAAQVFHTRREYLDRLSTWTRLAHAYSGEGGFADGGYIVPHVREFLDYQAESPTRPAPKLKARRALARYENIAQLIIGQKAAALTRTTPSRQVKDVNGRPHPLRAFWANVDGAGTHVDDFFAEQWPFAAVFGHLVFVLDRPAGPAPMTKADERPPYVAVFTPADVPDWATTGERAAKLSEIRLLEAVPRESVRAALAKENSSRSRVLTGEGWSLYQDGALLREGKWFREGRLPGPPVAYLYAKRHPFLPFMGQSVLGNPALFVDLFNLTSELRELLRAQTFGVLNVPLGDKVSVQQAQSMLGDTTGTESVLFSPQPAQYIQPAAANVASYQEERRQLLRTIFRLASIPFDSDSRDAESEGSLKLKREDMNQVLAIYADECERADYDLARLWFQFEYGPDRWQQEWDAAGVVIRYPENFDVTPFEVILEQAAAALTLEMPPTFQRELRRRLVPQFLPDLPEDVQRKIDQELEAGEPTRRRSRLIDPPEGA